VPSALPGFALGALLALLGLRFLRAMQGGLLASFGALLFFRLQLLGLRLRSRLFLFALRGFTELRSLFLLSFLFCEPSQVRQFLGRFLFVLLQTLPFEYEVLLVGGVHVGVLGGAIRWSADSGALGRGGRILVRCRVTARLMRRLEPFVTLLLLFVFPLEPGRLFALDGQHVLHGLVVLLLQLLDTLRRGGLFLVGCGCRQRIPLDQRLGDFGLDRLDPLLGLRQFQARVFVVLFLCHLDQPALRRSLRENVQLSIRDRTRRSTVRLPKETPTGSVTRSAGFL